MCSFVRPNPRGGGGRDRGLTITTTTTDETEGFESKESNSQNENAARRGPPFFVFTKSCRVDTYLLVLARRFINRRKVSFLDHIEGKERKGKIKGWTGPLERMHGRPTDRPDGL